MAKLPSPPIPLRGADPSPPDDALNPTTIVLNFLKSQGAPLNGDSIRKVLEQNARQPGYIPGLGNNAPSSEADDQAAMQAAGQGGGGGRSVGQSNAQLHATPPAGPLTTSQTGGQPNTTSAQPSTDVENQDSSQFDPIGALVAMGVPAAALWGASRFGGSAPQMNAVQGGMPSPTPGMPQISAADPALRLPGPEVPMQLGGPPTPLQLQGGQGPTALEGPMQKAIAGVEPYQPMAPGVQPVPPEMVGNMPRGPATVDPSVANEAMMQSGLRAPPRVPIRPRIPTGGGSGNLGALIGRLRIP